MYKRVLLKLSGEALASKESTFDSKMLQQLAEELKKITKMGVQVGIVVGGGNIIRGKFAKELNLPRVQADKMGMLGTLINALAVQGALDQAGVPSYVQSAVEVPRAADVADARKAMEHLNAGEIVIYGGGTGNPYFSTDSAAALRASEIEAEVILMAKNGVDGVYTADPDKDPTATKYDSLTYLEMLDKQLGVMDLTAASMCQDNNIGAIVFNMNDITNISRVINGEKIGTVITGGR
ncbi:MAG: UMP kinase [Erysipelotrichaceae bacterium]|nr:UMP kinase [Erysipelotrichaceae bacterium]